MLPTDKRRKRKLHGESCKAVKERLQRISVVPLANFEEIIDPSAYLLFLLLLFETLQYSSISERRGIQTKELIMKGLAEGLQTRTECNQGEQGKKQWIK